MAYSSTRSSAGRFGSLALQKPRTVVAPRRVNVSLKASAEPVATTTSTTGDGSKWEFCMTKEALLTAPNRRAQGDIPGAGKLALFWFKNEAYAVQGQCPHLGIPLAGGKITPEGNLVCSQHKSSWDLKSGEVDEWLPGNFINAVQRMVSPACPLEKYETKIEDGNIYVKVE